jgi:hypothetical protein
MILEKYAVEDNFFLLFFRIVGFANNKSTDFIGAFLLG